MRYRPAFTRLLFFLFLLAAMPAAAQTINVAPPTVTTERFPADHPPDNLPPEENGDAGLSIVTDGGVLSAPKWDSSTSTLTITEIGPVSVMGSITIRLPDNASQALTDHENGHNTLLTEEYNRVAATITTTAFRDLRGARFVGAGATDAERQANAWDQAKAARDIRLENAKNGIVSQADTLNSKYDDLTDHGRSPTVNSAQGVTKAKEERDRVLKVGNSARQPAQQGPKAGAVDPPVVTYDPGEDQSLVFNLPNALTGVTIDGITTVDDTLISLSAQAIVDIMRMVGIQEDGTILFSPSELTIFVSNSPVLHGYLLDPVYLPSSIPGFGGMIQAYLDIPPSFTGKGITNAIGSNFLSSFQNILDDPSKDAVPMFWFYTNERIFENSPQPVVLSSAGAMEFGASVPEPSTAALLAGALGFLLIFRLARRDR